ncbi:Uncharacterized protein ToN1_40470 [Aromatoleum petrolei]|nr:Uncharacterized protein ToN1_40470 [Aromatoleum petrolei]
MSSTSIGGAGHSEELASDGWIERRFTKWINSKAAAARRG